MTLQPFHSIHGTGISNGSDWNSTKIMSINIPFITWMGLCVSEGPFRDEMMYNTRSAPDPVINDIYIPPISIGWNFYKEPIAASIYNDRLEARLAASRCCGKRGMSMVRRPGSFGVSPRWVKCFLWTNKTLAVLEVPQKVVKILEEIPGRTVVFSRFFCNVQSLTWMLKQCVRMCLDFWLTFGAHIIRQ